MRVRLTMMAVCVLLATMMFGGTAFAVLSAPTGGSSMTIGNAADNLWETGFHLTAGISNTIYTVTTNYNDYTATSEVVLLSSLDGGTTWEPSQVMYSTAEAIERPAIAVGSDGTVHVVWWEGGYLYYRSTASASIATVNTAVDEGVNANYFRIVVKPNGNVTVVFKGQNTDNNGLFFNTGVLNAGVMEFEPTSHFLDGSTTNQQEHDVVCTSSGDVYIVGAHRNSSDGIKIWKNGTLFSNVCGTPANCMRGISAISMAASSSIVYVAWTGTDGTTPGLYYHKLNISSDTWVTPNPELVTSTTEPTTISMAVDTGGYPAIAWRDNSGATINISRWKSTNSTWYSPQSLSLPFYTYSASLAINANNKACISIQNETNATMQFIREQ